jgi:hypothetical protein
MRNLVSYSCDSPDDDLGKVKTCSATPVYVDTLVNLHCVDIVTEYDHLLCNG